MDWSGRIDTFSKIVTILAIIFGGIWSYLKYIRGQLFAIRLEVNVEGEFISNGKSSHLIVTTKLKNTAASPVHLSKITIKEELSGLRIFTYEAGDYKPETNEVHWNFLSIHRGFRHQWVDAGEEIKEHFMIPLPHKDYIAFKLELVVLTKDHVWEAASIIEAKEMKPAV